MSVAFNLDPLLAVVEAELARLPQERPLIPGTR